MSSFLLPFTLEVKLTDECAEVHEVVGPLLNLLPPDLAPSNGREGLHSAKSSTPTGSPPQSRHGLLGSNALTSPGTLQMGLGRRALLRSSFLSPGTVQFLNSAGISSTAVMLLTPIDIPTVTITRRCPRPVSNQVATTRVVAVPPAAPPPLRRSPRTSLESTTSSQKSPQVVLKVPPQQDLFDLLFSSPPLDQKSAAVSDPVTSSIVPLNSAPPASSDASQHDTSNEAGTTEASHAVDAQLDPSNEVPQADATQAIASKEDAVGDKEKAADNATGENSSARGASVASDSKATVADGTVAGDAVSPKLAAMTSPNSSEISDVAADAFPAAPKSIASFVFGSPSSEYAPQVAQSDFPSSGPTSSAENSLQPQQVQASSAQSAAPHEVEFVPVTVEELLPNAVTMFATDAQHFVALMRQKNAQGQEHIRLLFEEYCSRKRVEKEEGNGRREFAVILADMEARNLPPEVRERLREFEENEEAPARSDIMSKYDTFVAWVNTSNPGWIEEAQRKARMIEERENAIKTAKEALQLEMLQSEASMESAVPAMKEEDLRKEAIRRIEKEAEEMERNRKEQLEKLREEEDRLRANLEAADLKRAEDLEFQRHESKFEQLNKRLESGKILTEENEEEDPETCRMMLEHIMAEEELLRQRLADAEKMRAVAAAEEERRKEEQKRELFEHLQAEEEILRNRVAERKRKGEEEERAQKEERDRQYRELLAQESLVRHRQMERLEQREKELQEKVEANDKLTTIRREQEEALAALRADHNKQVEAQFLQDQEAKYKERVTGWDIKHELDEHRNAEKQRAMSAANSHNYGFNSGLYPASTSQYQMHLNGGAYQLGTAGHLSPMNPSLGYGNPTGYSNQPPTAGWGSVSAHHISPHPFVPQHATPPQQPFPSYPAQPPMYSNYPVAPSFPSQASGGYGSFSGQYPSMGMQPQSHYPPQPEQRSSVPTLPPISAPQHPPMQAFSGGPPNPYPPYSNYYYGN